MKKTKAGLRKPDGHGKIRQIACCLVTRQTAIGRTELSILREIDLLEDKLFLSEFRRAIKTSNDD